MTVTPKLAELSIVLPVRVAVFTFRNDAPTWFPNRNAELTLTSYVVLIEMAVAPFHARILLRLTLFE